jgi:hypothetical protein
MHIPSTIRTVFGPSSVPIRATIRVTITCCEFCAAIRQFERDAHDAGSAGNDDAATRGQHSRQRRFCVTANTPSTPRPASLVGHRSWNGHPQPREPGFPTP